ncbi:hypothetical protein [Vulcanisaeta souniana]|uniref:Uncharacterized protein n=1 Tax=Vulcanisaeta souniana JCM 11219 TaxID=1293586 RepID=A0ABN6SR31_9CREN|nr:hypothetical protein [Vulcanisaeta souniana]BDR92301.1 hypothetical protein Vsou_13940 [Vulcanisaeta souniana JCM 11219]
MLSDFLRRNWYWVLGILVSLFLFIINPVLFVIVFIAILVIYFLAFRRRKSRGNTKDTTTTVRILRSYAVGSASDVRLSKVCFSVGVGDNVVRVGDRWVSALSISTLDLLTLREVLNLGAIISDGNSHYLVIYGDNIDDVFVRLNTAAELLRSRNVLFKQLSSSELIKEVILRWMS